MSKVTLNKPATQIDKDGIARYAHDGHSMSDIPTSEQILAILRAVNGES